MSTCRGHDRLISAATGNESQRQASSLVCFCTLEPFVSPHTLVCELCDGNWQSLTSARRLGSRGRMGATQPAPRVVFCLYQSRSMYHAHGVLILGFLQEKGEGRLLSYSCLALLKAHLTSREAVMSVSAKCVYTRGADSTYIASFGKGARGGDAERHSVNRPHGQT